LVTRVPAVDGTRRDHKLRRPDRITDDLGRKMAARVARGGGCPHASRFPAPGPPSTNSAWHQQLCSARTAADYDRGRRQVTWSKHPLVVFWSAHPGLQQKIDQVTRRAGARRSQTAQDCTGSFLAFRRQRRRPSPDPIPECRLFSVPDVIRPNLVRAIGPVPGRRSAQAALWSAKKLSGGSASDAVNRGSKRNRVAQYGQRIVSAWPILI
jgi:hypothetical protein